MVSCGQKATEPSTINGVWQSVGSGWLLEITDSTSYSFYDITAISCLPSWRSDFSEIQESLRLTDDTLTLVREVLIYKFTRVSHLLERCNASLSEAKRKDPLYNFAVFGETVKEHYAFMELKQINWEELYQTQVGKLGTDASEADLYLAIEET